MITRKNQSAMTKKEWSDLIDALNKMHGIGAAAPAYRLFVRIHERAMNTSDMEGMSWGVHTMGVGMRGRNFLTWHRRYLHRFEKRLRKENPKVFIPYWDAITDRTIPAPLAAGQLLAAWGITRNWTPSRLADPSDVATLDGFVTHTSFQSALEGAVHSSVHMAVGGEMATASSPSDPLFWLHHANIDRLWVRWQANHPGENPTNLNETLKPSPIITGKVKNVLSIKKLGYQYV